LADGDTFGTVVEVNRGDNADDAAA